MKAKDHFSLHGPVMKSKFWVIGTSLCVQQRKEKINKTNKQTTFLSTPYNEKGGSIELFLPIDSLYNSLFFSFPFPFP